MEHGIFCNRDSLKLYYPHFWVVLTEHFLQWGHMHCVWLRSYDPDTGIFFWCQTLQKAKVKYTDHILPVTVNHPLFSTVVFHQKCLLSLLSSLWHYNRYIYFTFTNSNSTHFTMNYSEHLMSELVDTMNTLKTEQHSAAAISDTYTQEVMPT